MEQNMKEHISETLKKMLRKYGPDKITVAKLVEECGISRSLFYYYFADIFDVMVYHLETNLDRMVVQSLKEPTKEGSLCNFLKSIMAQKEGVIRILASKYREQVEREMMKAFEKYVRLLIERFLTVPVKPEELAYMVKAASYMIFGFVIDNLGKADPDIKTFSKYTIQFATVRNL